MAIVRNLCAASLMIFLALAGCLGGSGDHGDVRIAGAPDLSTLKSPVNSSQRWPACHLEPGDIAWPEVGGADKPLLPTTATIKTDAYGVSHIYADDPYSLWFANGYVQARDRLFQIDILRQVGYGEAARHLGPGQLGLDFEIHRELYTREELQAQLDAAPVEGQQVLQAFADGVNRFMAEAAARDQWPGEFAAVGRVPPPWQPLDSVALINYLIGFFGVDGGSELSNLARLAELESALPEQRAWEALGDWVWLRTDDTYTSIHPDDLILNGCEDPSNRKDVDHQTQFLPAASAAVTLGGNGASRIGLAGIPPQPDSYFAPVDRGLLQGFKWGSNAMVMDGSLTATGEPMMWGAPQMGYYKPPVPYQIGLHGAGFDAVGIGVAGAPGMVIGRNSDIAWTATSGIEDQVDLVTLELVGDRSYLWDGQTREMDCWIVEHQVLPTATNLALPEVLEQEVCRAQGWPVTAINEASGVAWMKKSTTRGEELMGALKWLQAPRMTSISEFQDLMADYPFTFNYFITSHEGVAQIHTGNVPLRAPGYDPRLPTPSGDAYEWLGEAYTRQMGTAIRDPERGYIANWNNAPVLGWRAGDQPGLWGPVQRVQQIEFWMQERLRETNNAFTLDDVQWVNWMAATHDSHALPFMPFLIAAARADPDLADMETALTDWFVAGVPWRDSDGDGAYDDPAHAIWDVMMQEMFTRISGDELGSMTKQVALDPPVGANNGDHGTLNNEMGPILKALQGSTRHDWCDDVATPATETCLQQLTAGLHAAKEALSARFGTTDVNGWKEPVHTDKFLAFGAFEADERPMINRGSWVQLVSMAESEKSRSALPPGNSGLITLAEIALATAGLGEPERLTAELDMYWTNAFKPFPLTPTEVDQATVDEMTLVIA